MEVFAIQKNIPMSAQKMREVDPDMRLILMVDGETPAAALKGVSQISSFRPARVSRKWAEAPSVEEPVARTRVEG